MAFEFRWWKNIGPFRITASRNGISTSGGNRWFRILLGGGRARGTLRVPGKGLSWTRSKKR